MAIEVKRHASPRTVVSTLVARREDHREGYYCFAFDVAGKEIGEMTTYHADIEGAREYGRALRTATELQIRRMRGYDD